MYTQYWLGLEAFGKEFSHFLKIKFACIDAQKIIKCRINQTQTNQKPSPPTLLNQVSRIGKIHCVPGWYQILSLWFIYGAPETYSQRKHEKH